MTWLGDYCPLSVAIGNGRTGNFASSAGTACMRDSGVVCPWSVVCARANSCPRGNLSRRSELRGIPGRRICSFLQIKLPIAPRCPVSRYACESEKRVLTWRIGRPVRIKYGGFRSACVRRSRLCLHVHDCATALSTGFPQDHDNSSRRPHPSMSTLSPPRQHDMIKKLLAHSDHSYGDESRSRKLESEGRLGTRKAYINHYILCVAI